MKILTALVLAVLLAAGSLQAQPQVSDQQIIQAFLSSPEIINAQRSVPGSAEPGTPRILLRNSICGVAGCQFTALVAQPFERKAADPSVTHILGYVHVDARGNISLVERVMLVPEKELQSLQEKAGDR